MIVSMILKIKTSDEDQNELQQQRDKVEHDLANLEAEFENELSNLKSSSNMPTSSNIEHGNMEIFIKTPTWLYDSLFKTSPLTIEDFKSSPSIQQVYNSCKYQSYKYFWSRGYYLTGGAKFGGDFLVYPGEPSRFHSQFILVCVETAARFGALTLKELITYARMATSVKKTFVLAYLCEKRTDNQHDTTVDGAVGLVNSTFDSIRIDQRLELVLVSINWSHI